MIDISDIYEIDKYRAKLDVRKFFMYIDFLTHEIH